MRHPLTSLRRGLLAAALGVIVVGSQPAAAVAPLPAVVHVDGERFEISGEGNSVTGLRRAPVPYESVADITSAIGQPRPIPAAVRLVRDAPPQIIDYVFCVTEDGVLVVGRQVRTLDAPSGRYVFTDGDIKRAYPALEAIAPWTWIVEIPVGRELGLTLELRAMTSIWPVRAVFVTPRVVR